MHSTHCRGRKVHSTVVWEKSTVEIFKFHVKISSWIKCWTKSGLKK